MRNLSIFIVLCLLSFGCASLDQATGNGRITVKKAEFDQVTEIHLSTAWLGKSEASPGANSQWKIGALWREDNPEFVILEILMPGWGSIQSLEVNMDGEMRSFPVSKSELDHGDYSSWTVGRSAVPINYLRKMVVANRVFLRATMDGKYLDAYFSSDKGVLGGVAARPRMVEFLKEVDGIRN